jgi:hypothetical protein
MVLDQQQQLTTETEVEISAGQIDIAKPSQVHSAVTKLTLC